MINVNKAENLILNSSPTTKIEQINISDSIGRVLASDIYATRNQPPFHRVMMDGIALDSKSKRESYTIEGIQAAGDHPLELTNKNCCIEVMTGAVLPRGCDCVIPYELINLDQTTQTASVEQGHLNRQQNIHQESSDYQKDDRLLAKGTLITAPIIAIIASQGSSKVNVFKYPKVAIISTGTELVDLDKEVLPHQIYMSNSYAIESELKSYGLQNIQRIHIDDNKSATKSLIHNTLNEFEIIILTGGVSKGKFDFIPEILADLGVHRHFHKVKQKPGKPMWYGTLGEKQIFALPGNPVSCLVCLRRFIIPSLNKSLAKKEIVKIGVLSSKVEFKKDLTLFKPVAISYTENGQLQLRPLEFNGSGDFNSLGQSDGFIELPAQRDTFDAGEVARFYPWHI